jgi:hypothetical protein
VDTFGLPPPPQLFDLKKIIIFSVEDKKCILMQLMAVSSFLVYLMVKEKLWTK